MTNKERYKQAFSAIHPSRNISLEVEKMKNTSKKYNVSTMIATVAVCVMVLIGATVAYATDFCGVQRIIQLWIHGEKTEVNLELDGKGSYSMSYSDDENNSRYQNGGGVSFGSEGEETPLSDDELMEHLMRPEVSYEEDGTVFVYWYGQQIDITDKFESDICYIELKNCDEVLYMTVRYNNGFSTSPNELIISNN